MTDDIVKRLLVCAKFDPDQQEAADEIERLRAELAAERERADAHYRALENVTAKKERLRAELAVANVRLGDAMRNKDIITDWYDKASAERDALRAVLKEVLDNPDEIWGELSSRIDAALKGD